MKNISALKASKYSTKEYELLEDDIYRCGDVCVITLQFQQEPEMDEGTSSADISQYPLEDILDRFNVHISDFYDKLHELQKSGKLNSIAYGSYDVKEVLNIYMNDGYDKSISDDDFERLMHEAVDIQEQRKRDEFNNGLNNNTTVENDMPF